MSLFKLSLCWQARGLRWLCNSGFNGCEELLRLGITGLVAVDSSDEAIFMLRKGQADAYLADLPALVRLQSQANMQVAAPGWMRDTSLAMAVGPDNKVLQGCWSGRSMTLPQLSGTASWRRTASSTKSWTMHRNRSSSTSASKIGWHSIRS